MVSLLEVIYKKVKKGYKVGNKKEIVNLASLNFAVINSDCIDSGHILISERDDTPSDQTFHREVVPSIYNGILTFKPVFSDELRKYIDSFTKDTTVFISTYNELTMYLVGIGANVCMPVYMKDGDDNICYYKTESIIGKTSTQKCYLIVDSFIIMGTS